MVQHGSHFIHSQQYNLLEAKHTFSNNNGIPMLKQDYNSVDVFKQEGVSTYAIRVEKRHRTGIYKFTSLAKIV